MKKVGYPWIGFWVDLDCQDLPNMPDSWWVFRNWKRFHSMISMNRFPPGWQASESHCTTTRVILATASVFERVSRYSWNLGYRLCCLHMYIYIWYVCVFFFSCTQLLHILTNQMQGNSYFCWLKIQHYSAASNRYHSRCLLALSTIPRWQRIRLLLFQSPRHKFLCRFGLYNLQNDS